jgi:hypothetical protein
MNNSTNNFGEYDDSKIDEDITKFSALIANKKLFEPLQVFLSSDPTQVPTVRLPSSSAFSRLIRDLCYLPEWLKHIAVLPFEAYLFSNILEQWIKSYRAYPLNIDETLFQTCLKPQAFQYPFVNHALCRFLTELHHHLNSSDYKERNSRDETEAEKNYNEYSNYINELFKHHARLIVIRIDFSYTVPRTFEQVQRDLVSLYTNARHNSLFDGLEGYITKIEYGLRKKIHVHAMFLFNGHKRQGSSDSYLAKQIGDYWDSTITKGMGSYWNCNDGKEKCYRYVGIGLVAFDDKTKRENLLLALHYLCKKETQVIKPRNQLQAKTLRRGNLRNKNIKLGRPRMVDRIESQE